MSARAIWMVALLVSQSAFAGVEVRVLDLSPMEGQFHSGHFRGVSPNGMYAFGELIGPGAQDAGGYQSVTARFDGLEYRSSRVFNPSGGNPDLGVTQQGVAQSIDNAGQFACEFEDYGSEGNRNFACRARHRIANEGGVTVPSWVVPFGGVGVPEYDPDQITVLDSNVMGDMLVRAQKLSGGPSAIFAMVLSASGRIKRVIQSNFTSYNPEGLLDDGTVVGTLGPWLVRLAPFVAFPNGMVYDLSALEFPDSMWLRGMNKTGLSQGRALVFTTHTIGVSGLDRTYLVRNHGSIDQPDFRLRFITPPEGYSDCAASNSQSSNPFEHFIALSCDKLNCEGEANSDDEFIFRVSTGEMVKLRDVLPQQVVLPDEELLDLDGCTVILTGVNQQDADTAYFSGRFHKMLSDGSTRVFPAVFKYQVAE
jgi:hypothetical protein